MDIRGKLVELLKTTPTRNGYTDLGDIADHLIANGVTVQGDKDINVPTKWISVTERLPEEKVDCFVNYQHAYCYNDDYWAIGICFYDGEKFQLNPAYKVTHWMPIPRPPKGE